MVDPFIAGKFANTGSSPPVLMEGTISFGSIWPTYDNRHKIVFLMGQVDLPTAFEWYKSGLRADCVWSAHRLTLMMVGQYISGKLLVSSFGKCIHWSTFSA